MPREPTLRLEVLPQGRDERGKVDDVGRRVRGHRGRQRPLAPVGALVRLVERDPDARGEEGREPDLLLADELRGEHRVEEGRGAEAVTPEEEPEVVVGPVHEERPGGEPREERREVEPGERVREERVGAEADLHETDLLEVVVEGVGFRVERDRRPGIGVEPAEKDAERTGLRDVDGARAVVRGSRRRHRSGG